MTESSLTKRILLVTGSLQGGGAERVLSDMANYWAERGVEVAFATWSGPDVADFYTLDGRVQRVWMNVSSRRTRVGAVGENLRRLRRLREVIRSVHPGTVLSFITTSNVLTIASAAGIDVRVVVSERVEPSADVTVPPSWNALRRLMYRHADCVVTQTAAAGDWIEQHCRTEPLVLPNPLRDLPRIKVEREPLVVGIGRLDRQKGFDLLLEAFARVAESLPAWRLALVGEGREEAALRKQCKQLGLQHRVEFVGHVKDVETWMARAGLVVQPSRFEGFPNVLLECMAMGAAVISADCPSGPSEIIEDRTSGRLVEIDNVAELTDAMSELMSDDEQRGALGREAIKVRERYRREKVMADWEVCVFPRERRTS